MKHLFLFFLQVGGTSFGKMVATHKMYEEYVDRSRILSKEDFFALNGFLRLFPGPTQSQMSIALGKIHGGTVGGILAGAAYLLPSFCFITLGAYFYFEQRALLPISTIVAGINVVSISLLLHSSFNMAKKSITSPFEAGLALVSAALTYAGFGLFVIFGISAAAAFVYHGGAKLLLEKIRGRFFALGLPGLLFIFWYFFKLGLLTYGGGLALVPFIQQTVVERLGWLSSQDFLAGFALGQATPGPVILTVAFIGYKAALLAGAPGALGALVASSALMLPSFIMILTLSGFFPKLKKLELLSKILQSFMPAVLGAVLVSSLGFFPAALPLPAAWALMLVALFLLYKGISPIILIPAFALLGFTGILG